MACQPGVAEGRIIPQVLAGIDKIAPGFPNGLARRAWGRGKVEDWHGSARRLSTMGPWDKFRVPRATIVARRTARA
jgi:hypothetical protein